MPALLAVHESAPDDPSVPLQRAHPQPQDPPPLGTPPSQPKCRATLSAKPAERSGKQATTSAAKHASIDSTQQDELTPTSGYTIADGDGDSDDGNSSSSASSDATEAPGWGFKTARPPGYRQKVAQTADGSKAGSIAAEDEQETRLQEWPSFWYAPEQLIDENRDSEFGDEQRLMAEQILHQKQQQEPGAASQDAPVTSIASSVFETPSKTEDLQSNSPRPSAEDSQQSTASRSAAGALDAAASGHLPKLDLLAQFSESNSSAEDRESDMLDDANAAQDAAASPDEDTADTAPPGFDQALADSDEGESRMMVNLNGAQVLTPDGWQSLSSRTPLGTAWEQGNCLTVGMTLQYHMSASSGQITAVTCGWATLDAFAWTIQDMMSLYIRCTGLHKW